MYSFLLINLPQELQRLFFSNPFWVPNCCVPIRIGSFFLDSFYWEAARNFIPYGCCVPSVIMCHTIFFSWMNRRFFPDSKPTGRRTKTPKNFINPLLNSVGARSRYLTTLHRDKQNKRMIRYIIDVNSVINHFHRIASPHHAVTLYINCFLVDFLLASLLSGP